MNHQFSIRAPNLSSSPIGEQTKDLNNVMVHIEFEPFQQNIDEMKATGSPNYHQHYFIRLNNMSLLFRNLFVPPEARSIRNPS
jgi:hypothetical protein